MLIEIVGFTVVCSIIIACVIWMVVDMKKDTQDVEISMEEMDPTSELLRTALENEVYVAIFKVSRMSSNKTDFMASLRLVQDDEGLPNAQISLRSLHDEDMVLVTSEIIIPYDVSDEEIHNLVIEATRAAIIEWERNE